MRHGGRICEFKVILVYTVRSRSDKTTQRDPGVGEWGRQGRKGQIDEDDRVRDVRGRAGTKKHRGRGGKWYTVREEPERENSSYCKDLSCGWGMAQWVCYLCKQEHLSADLQNLLKKKSWIY